MDIGLVILAPDRNLAALKTSLASTSNHMFKRDVICVVPEETTQAELVQLGAVCAVYRSGTEVTCLINDGMSHNKHEWALFLTAGSRVCRSIERKLHVFAKQESDILFPALDAGTNFVDAPFNGVLINKRFFDKMGGFPTASMKKEGLNYFEVAKLLWSITAMENGCAFKAIVGMKVG